MDNYYLDYFYGLEADAYSFIRVPKLLINLPIYKDLTSDDKLLYGILLDRMSLSAKNRWMDDDGRVYIIFTIEDVMEALNCAQHKAVELLKAQFKSCRNRNVIILNPIIQNIAILIFSFPLTADQKR